MEKELGKKGKKATFGSIQQAPELPTKTRILRKTMDNRDGDSPGKLTNGDQAACGILPIAGKYDHSWEGFS